VVNDGIIENITKVIVDNVFQFEGLWNFDFVSRFINFGADGVSIFHGPKTDVTTQKTWQFNFFKTSFGV
jgi:hypothetical protein